MAHACSIRPVFDEERRRCTAWSRGMAEGGISRAQEAEREEMARIRESKRAAEERQYLAFEQASLLPEKWEYFRLLRYWRSVFLTLTTFGLGGNCVLQNALLCLPYCVFQFCGPTCVCGADDARGVRSKAEGEAANRTRAWKCERLHVYL